MRTKTERLIRFLAIPARALARARDLYVKSMSEYADRIGHAAAGCPGAQYPPLPRSFTLSSSGRTEIDGIEELIRAASIRGFIDLEEMMKEKTRRRSRPGPSRIVPSGSCRMVGMGKIDEEGPCEFEDSPAAKGIQQRGDLYLRSRSYGLAASHRTKFMKF